MATIRLKNSVVASKAPLAVDLVLGEVALNANSASPALYFKDNDDNIIKLEPGGGVEPSPTPPASPEEGDLWYNETTNSLNYWNGSEWVELGQAGDSPVTSVNGEVGVVVLDAADVGALSDTTPLDFVPLDSWAAIPELGDTPNPDPDPTPGTPAVVVTSSSFTSGAAIGAAYQYDQGPCGGANTSPQLSWQFDDLPNGATITSWEVSCVDTDANGFPHWSVTAIPAAQTSIAENGSWQAGAVIGDTGYSPGPANANGWGGPCPPTGETHTYTIIITARYTDSGAQSLASEALTFTSTGA